MRPCKTYAISTNPQDNYIKFDSCGDHTSGHTNMLVVNGDTIHGTVIWRQTVRNINPFTDYDFSFWFSSVNILRPATLVVLINGDTLSPWPIWLRDSTCFWSEAKYVWNSGNSDTAEISIYDINLSFFGNDFAIDDISLMPYCRLQACAGQNVSTCKDTPVMLDGNAMDGFEPYIYKWSPATGLNNPNIKNPIAKIPATTQYILEVTDDRKCKAYDTITVHIYDEPNSTILASPPLPTCPCETVTLTAAVEYYDYLWSTGDTTRSINVTEPGTYSLKVTDKNGCTSSRDIDVTHKQVSVNVLIDTIQAPTGKEIQLYLHTDNEENFLDCGYTSYTAKISYNASMLIPRKNTPFGKVVNGIETITVTEDLADAEPQPLNFYTLWGNAECTDITIDDITFNCDSVQASTTSGQFCLTDLCNASGLRLFDSGKGIFLKTIQENDMLTVEISAEIDAIISLELYDYTGNINSSLINNKKILRGTQVYKFTTNTLNRGLYFLTLSGNDLLITQPVLIK